MSHLWTRLLLSIHFDGKQGLCIDPHSFLARYIHIPIPWIRFCFLLVYSILACLFRNTQACQRSCLHPTMRSQRKQTRRQFLMTKQHRPLQMQSEMHLWTSSSYCKHNTIRSVESGIICCNQSEAPYGPQGSYMLSLIGPRVTVTQGGG